MRLSPDKLQRHLSSDPLAPVYLVGGDEPLQGDEACDAIRAAARAAGHANREVLEAGPGFDWGELAAEASALSLFTEKKIIDLRIPSGKPGTEGSKALSAYAAHAPDDTLLLIRTPRLDRQQQKSKWVRSLESAGALIQIWPIDVQALPGWIEQRMRQAGLQPDRDAVRLLADRVEGNLLAARQEIDKLLLLHGAGPVDAEQLSDAVADSARYDVFELADSALQGDLARCLRILGGLRAEGVAAPLVLWALHRDIGQLAGVSADTATGRGIEQALGRIQTRNNRKPLLRGALQRLRPTHWLALLRLCQQADAAIKGADTADPWLKLEQLCTRLCVQH